MDFYKAEYIWIDGTEPVSKLRSKGNVIPNGQEPPIWGFDGSSTNQAVGTDSRLCIETGLLLRGPDSRR